MRERSLMLSAALGVVTALAGAQGGMVDAACSNTAVVGPAQEGGNPCQIAADTYVYAAQQYAAILGGGNPEIGRADGMDGFPKFRVVFHVTALSFIAPALKASGGGISTGPAVSTTLATQTTDFGNISVDGLLGLLGGIDLGVAKIGALDAIVSLNVVPAQSAGGYSVGGKKFDLGYGARIGVLQEGKILPGVGVSYMVRDLPVTTVTASDVQENFVTISGRTMNTTSWSVTVGKHFGIVSLVAGGGQTKYTSSGVLSWSVSGVTPVSPPTIGTGSTQTNYFGDFGLALTPFFHLVLELGRVSGNTVKTYNTFDPPSGSAHSFVSFAVAVGH